jgi:hypothetical protein
MSRVTIKLLIWSTILYQVEGVRTGTEDDHGSG